MKSEGFLKKVVKILRKMKKTLEISANMRYNECV
jgi:hypothetical protein